MTNVSQIRPETEDRFEEFWKNYPLRKGKAKARSLFKLITRQGGYDSTVILKDGGESTGRMPIHLEATPDEIIDGAKTFAKSLVIVVQDKYKLNLDFCPHATTWLNNARWEDD